jgi:ADP-ribosyl-[dinitrogen reductase] hydrolase
MPSLEERVVGGFLGVAAGDALGVPVEFLARESLKANPVREMRGAGVHGQLAGTWSDDTSMSLCLAESLLNGFDLEDQAKKFCAWYYEGLWTARGDTFDVGLTTREALNKASIGRPPEQCGLTSEESNGNGSLMRSLPIAVWGRELPPERLADYAARSSSITHRHPRTLLACGLYVVFASHLLKGVGAAAALGLLRRDAWTLCIKADKDSAGPYSREFPRFDRLLSPEFPRVAETEIKSGGYVIETLEAAIWCLLQGKDFADVVLRAVNLGGDSDTTGAVAGGLAGILYGEQAVPQPWQMTIARKDDIVALARRLAQAPPAKT